MDDAFGVPILKTPLFTGSLGDRRTSSLFFGAKKFRWPLL